MEKMIPVLLGAMANTFLKANGVCVGKSLFEEDKLDIALQLHSNIVNVIK